MNCMAMRGYSRNVAGEGICAALEARIVELANPHQAPRMDREFCGLPEEWPDQALRVGANVWLEIPGMPNLGIVPGRIVYSDVQRDRVCEVRTGRVGVEIEQDLPLTGRVTYWNINSLSFWPRSTEQPKSVQALVSL